MGKICCALPLICRDFPSLCPPATHPADAQNSPILARFAARASCSQSITHHCTHALTQNEQHKATQNSTFLTQRLITSIMGTFFRPVFASAGCFSWCRINIPYTGTTLSHRFMRSIGCVKVNHTATVAILSRSHTASHRYTHI